MGEGNRAGADKETDLEWCGIRKTREKRKETQEAVMGKGWGTGDRTLKHVCAVCGKDPQMKDSSQTV